MFPYTYQVLSEALTALSALPPIDWSIVAIELLVLTSLALFAIAIVRDAIGWARRRWFSRGRA